MRNFVWEVWESKMKVLKIIEIKGERGIKFEQVNQIFIG